MKKKSTKKKTTKTGLRRSVSGRRYRGLSESVKKRTLEKIKARKKAERVKKTGGKVGRPEKKFTYNANLVKTANERLRRLEKQGLTDDSNEYVKVRTYAKSYPKTKGKIYNISDDERRIRFLNKEDWQALSPEEKEYFERRLQAFLESETSVTGNIEAKYRKAFETFKANKDSKIGDLFKNIEYDDYKRFFRTYRDKVIKDKNDTYGYDVLSQAFEFIDIEKALTDNQIEEIFEYLRDERWDLIPNEYILDN